MKLLTIEGPFVCGARLRGKYEATITIGPRYWSWASKTRMGALFGVIRFMIAGTR